MAKELILQSTNEFSNWIQSLKLSPTINLLKQSFDDVLNRCLHYLKHKVTEKEFLLVSQTDIFLKDKYLKSIISSMKDLSENGANPDYLEMINRMLDYQKNTKA